MSLEQEETIREHNLHQESIINHKYSQEELILTYLRKGNSLTPMEALRLFGTWALSSRISNLHKAGYIIKSELVKGDNGKHFAKYYL